MRFSDRFEVLGEVRFGAYSKTCHCRDSSDGGREVWVKRVYPEIAKDKGALSLFEKEIATCRKVDHPNVLRILDRFDLEDAIGYLYPAPEVGILSSIMDRTAPELPISAAVSILIQLFNGAQAIHEAHITHRNLSPETIFLFRGQQVKIGEFSFACGYNGERDEEAGAVVGELDYVSPEYMLKSMVDWRSDIYGLGVLGYELITRSSPFSGDSVYATMVKRLKQEPPPPSTLRKDCPSGLDSIVLKALKIDPLARYQSASAAAEDLSNLKI